MNWSTASGLSADARSDERNEGADRLAVEPLGEPEKQQEHETARSETAVQRAAGDDRADAERYRWLRERGRIGFTLGGALRATVAFQYWTSPETLDANLDAAMKERP